MKQLLLSFSLLTEEVEKKMLQKTGEEEEIAWILQTIDPADKILSLSPLSKYLVEGWLGGEVLSASISSFLSPFDLDARGGLSW